MGHEDVKEQNKLKFLARKPIPEKQPWFLYLN